MAGKTADDTNAYLPHRKQRWDLSVHDLAEALWKYVFTEGRAFPCPTARPGPHVRLKKRADKSRSVAPHTAGDTHLREQIPAGHQAVLSTRTPRPPPDTPGHAGYVKDLVKDVIDALNRCWEWTPARHPAIGRHDMLRNIRVPGCVVFDLNAWLSLAIVIVTLLRFTSFGIVTILFARRTW